MKNKTNFVSLLIFLGLILSAPCLYAESIERAGVTSVDHTIFRPDEMRLNPSERIQLNVVKAEKNPALRGRWDVRSQEPASSGAYVSDNLSQKILGQFRQDPELSEIPAFLKVRSRRGHVIIEGTVKSQEDKNIIESRVRRMADVQSVENRLTVKSFDSNFATD